MFLKITTQTFEAGDFLTFFKGFGVFEVHFLIEIFLIKKTPMMRHEAQA